MRSGGATLENPTTSKFLSGQIPRWFAGSLWVNIVSGCPDYCLALVLPAFIFPVLYCYGSHSFVYVLARLFDRLHIQARPGDSPFPYAHDGHSCHLQVRRAPKSFVPHHVPLDALPQHPGLEVGEALEHARPVLVHLSLTPESPVGVGRLLAPVIGVEAFHHRIGVMTVHGLSQTFDHRRHDSASFPVCYSAVLTAAFSGIPARAAPAIPALLCISAATTLVRAVRWGKNFSDFLLMPPPMTIRSGQRRNSILWRYSSRRSAYSFQLRSSRLRALSAALCSASLPLTSMCPNSVLGTSWPSTNREVPMPVPNVSINTTPS